MTMIGKLIEHLAKIRMGLPDPNEEGGNYFTLGRAQILELDDGVRGAIETLRTMEGAPVLVHETCTQPCTSFFKKEAPAYLNGELNKMEHSWRKFHECGARSLAPPVAPPKPTISDRAPTYPPQPSRVVLPSETFPRFPGYPHRETHCWNCRAELDSRDNYRCSACRWLRCYECAACGCGYRTRFG